MRKLLIAVLALAAMVAVASVALAANTYTVHLAGTKPVTKGSKAHPVPVQLNFGFQVAETDPSKRGTPVERFAIGTEGLVTNPKFFPKCSFGDLDDQAGVPAKCNKAFLGSGLVKNAAGPSGDQSLGASSPCNLQLRLYNNGSGMVLRLDSNGKPAPPDFETDAIGCLLPIATAINGKFVKTKVGGLPASDYRFSVPENLKHPLTGVDNSVRESIDKILRKVKKNARIGGTRRDVGFYEAIGCKGHKRTVRATFDTEATATQPSQTFTANKTGKC